MYHFDHLKNLVGANGVRREDSLLFCLAVEVDRPKPVAEIRDLAYRAGLRSVRQWNASSILSRAKGKTRLIDGGWELTPDGRSHVAKLAGVAVAGATAQIVAGSLRGHLDSIQSPETRNFVEEAIACYEVKLYRAAVVLSWVGAVSLLYDQVIALHLPAFNAEAKRRDSKWKEAKTPDDLGRMKESNFLDVIESLSIIGPNVKRELKKCLTTRNGCGHPNSLKLGEHAVAAHIEILLLNIFAKL